MSTAVDDWILSDAERSRLAQLEKDIDLGMSSWLVAGLAIQEIREKKLWRESHSSYKEYVAKRWSHGVRYLNNVLQSAMLCSEIQKRLGDGATLPATEYTARALHSSPDPTEVWRRTLTKSGGKEPSHALIKIVIKEMVDGDKVTAVVPDNSVPAESLPIEEKVEKTDEPAAAVTNGVTEKTETMPLPSIKGERALLNASIARAFHHDLKGWLKELFEADCDRPGMERLGRRRGAIKVHVDNILEIISVSVPGSVCTICKGNGCPACEEYGWVK